MCKIILVLLVVFQKVIDAKSEKSEPVGKVMSLRCKQMDDTTGNNSNVKNSSCLQGNESTITTNLHSSDNLDLDGSTIKRWNATTGKLSKHIDKDLLPLTTSVIRTNKDNANNAQLAKEQISSEVTDHTDKTTSNISSEIQNKNNNSSLLTTSQNNEKKLTVEQEKPIQPTSLQDDKVSTTEKGSASDAPDLFIINRNFIRAGPSQVSCPEGQKADEDGVCHKLA